MMGSYRRLRGWSTNQLHSCFQMGGVGNHANWLDTNRLLNRDGQCLFSHDQPIPDHDNLKWNDLASDRAHLPLHSSNGQAGLLERASEPFCDTTFPTTL